MSENFKFCPKCGAEREENQKFCPNCGYSYENPQPEKKQKSGESFFKRAINWIKSHLKIVIPVAVALAVIIVLSCTIPAVIASFTNGTYYKLKSDGEIDKTTYFILKSGNWTDEDGESGTYKKNGESIVFYYSFFGETDEFSGTVAGGVLKLDTGVGVETYISEKHKHSYGEWKTLFEATCTGEGSKARTCDCGVTEKQSIEKIPHTLGDWSFDDDNHWKICSVCYQSVEEAAHTDKDNCTACGYPVFNYQLSEDGTYYTVTGLIADTDVANIPSVYNGLPVTAICDSAFGYCSGLTSVTIPDSVTTIGTWTFSNCTALTSVTIGNGVTVIGDRAFINCSALTSVTIGNSVTKIDFAAFSGCSSLTSIIIPDSVTVIDNNAFDYCSALTSVTIGNGVIEIYGNAFRNCSKLTSIAIPDSVIRIGGSAFSNCTGLTEITIPDSVTTIDSYAFLGCSGVTSVTIGKGVTKIGEHAFEGCSKLTSIVIPDGIIEIASYAFKGCSKLTSVTIPDSVNVIGNCTFMECSGLTDIYFAGTKAQWNAMSKYTYWNENTGNYTVHCSDGDIEKE